jgi:hypothetical protein
MCSENNSAGDHSSANGHLRASGDPALNDQLNPRVTANVEILLDRIFEDDPSADQAIEHSISETSICRIKK